MKFSTTGQQKGDLYVLYVSKLTHGHVIINLFSAYINTMCQN